MHFYDLFPEETKEKFKSEAEVFFANKKEFKNFLNQVQRSDGQKLWAVTNALPFTDDQGRLLGFKGNDTDVTERIVAEEALTEQTRLLKLVTDNMFDMVVLKDMNACITYIAKAHNSLGYKSQDLIGHSCLELVHEEEVEFLKDEIEKLKHDASYVLKAEYRVKSADGSYLWLESLGWVLLDDRENPNGILFSSRDITVRKSAQSELRLSTLRFQNLFDNMSQGVVFQSVEGDIVAVNPAAEQNWLVYEIVHDITIRNRYFEAMESQNKILKDIAWTQSHLVRAPLARILGLVDMLKEREYSEMSQDQIIQLICTSSEELDAVIRDVSEKAYLAGKFEPETEVIAPVETQNFKVIPDVLLVDDDRIILTMHKGAVVKQGLTDAPYLFINGETAFQHLIEHDAEMKVFIIFLDLNMPVMDGWEFLEKLENVSWKSTIKVVVLTSSVDTADRLRAQQFRYVVSYQNKPVNASMISELRFHPELKNYWPSVLV